MEDGKLFAFEIPRLSSIENLGSSRLKGSQSQCVHLGDTMHVFYRGWMGCIRQIWIVCLPREVAVLLTHLIISF